MMMLLHSDVQTSTWILDSGANICIVIDKSLFDQFATLDYPVGTADNEAQIHITGGGFVTLPLCVNGQETADIALSAVAYARTARCNILSLSWLGEKAKLHGERNTDSITICNCDDRSHGKEDVIGIAPFIDGLPQLQVANVVNAKVPEEDERIVMATLDNEKEDDNGEDENTGGYTPQEDDIHDSAGHASEQEDDLHDSEGDASQFGAAENDGHSADDLDVPSGVLPTEVVPIQKVSC